MHIHSVLIDNNLLWCYIFLVESLYKQTGKELKSMIVRKVSTG